MNEIKCLDASPIHPTCSTYLVRYQTRPGFCGPAAVVNCLRCLGKKVAERRIGAASKCTEDAGSSPEDLVEAIRAFEFGATQFETADRSAEIGRAHV